MRIGLISTATPLVDGGYRFIVNWLHEQLADAGHEVEVIYLPFVDGPGDLLPQMAAYRLIRLDEHFDRVITFRPQAHHVHHRRKVVWFIHHLRIFYDLWDTEYRPLADTAVLRALRQTLVAADTAALAEAHRVFTNSHVVQQRLRRFNGVESEVLYPPVHRPERFRAGAYGNEIVCICRMEEHKRQHLMLEALGRTQTPVRLTLCGTSQDPNYPAKMKDILARLDVADRVTIVDRWITEEEKVDFLETALASVYLPFDEDSYGYPTLEAAHARRCTVTTTDSGGVLEFVQDGVNGLITSPDPAMLGQAFDRLFLDRSLAARLGAAAETRVAELDISWKSVLKKVLA